MRTVDAAGLSIGDGHPPRIMGVLNVSRESPYKPSVFDDPGAAAEYVDTALIDEGADIVDVGLESANKRYEVLSAEEELDRLGTAVETIESVSGDAVFSIETRYHEVAEEALKRGFEMVNDICGFADPKMPDVCAEYDVAVGKMASPPDLERPGAIEDVDDGDRYLRDRPPRSLTVVRWFAHRSVFRATEIKVARCVHRGHLHGPGTRPDMGSWVQPESLASGGRVLDPAKD